MAKTITDYVLGSIPEKIQIIKGAPEIVSWAWENSVVAQHDVKHDIKAHPIWVADASDSRQRKSIEKQYAGYYLAYNSWPRSRPKKPKTLNKVEMENKPFGGVRFVGMHTRYSGKTEYFVVLPGNLLVRCKPAALMDAMQECGINKGGEIPGEFIFARCDGEMLVVRVGSALHKACIAADERRKLDKKEKFALTAGRIYRTVSGNYAVFLGFINTVNVNLILTPAQKSLAKAAEHYSYNAGRLDVPLPSGWQNIALTYTPWNMATMWLETSFYDKNASPQKVQKDLQKQVNYLNDATQWDYAKILKTHSYVEEIHGLECELPVDLFEKARRSGFHAIEDTIHYQLGRRRDDRATYNLSGNRSPHLDRFEVSSQPFHYDNKKAKEYNDEHHEDLKKAYSLYRDVAEALPILEHAIFANSIVFGMQPIINEHIEKIINKFRKP